MKVAEIKKQNFKAPSLTKHLCWIRLFLIQSAILKQIVFERMFIQLGKQLVSAACSSKADVTPQLKIWHESLNNLDKFCLQVGKKCVCWNIFFSNLVIAPGKKNIYLFERKSSIYFFELYTYIYIYIYIHIYVIEPL